MSEQTSPDPGSGVSQEREDGAIPAFASPPVAPNAVQVVSTQWEISPVMFGFLFLIGVFFAYQVVGSIATLAVVGFDMSAKNVAPLRVMTAVAQFLFLLGPALLAIRLRRWKYTNALRLHAPGLAPSILVILCVVALQFVMQGYMQAQDFVLTNYLIPPSLQPLLKKLEELIQGMYRELLAMHSPGELLFVWFVVALTPAICEEAVFRGVAQRAFERGLRQRWAMVLTAVTFAFFHLYPTQFVPLTAIGLFLSVIVWRGNSLYLGVIGHLANNSFAVLTMYFSGNADGSQDLAAGPGGLASAGITLAALAALAMFVALFWKLTRPSTFLTPSDAR